MLGLDAERGMQEPLLAPDDALYSQQAAAVEVIEELPPHQPRSSVRISSLNLTNTILGAGMFALPRAFAGLGLLGGTAMIIAVAAMTYLSADVMLRASERVQKYTYAGTMARVWGRPAAVLVRASIILACGGFLVLYLIILTDVVIGTEEYTGVIPDLFPSLSFPLPWYLSRNAMLTWFALAVAPLISTRTLGGLARVSAFKVTCALLCTLALALLALAAALQGKLEGTRLFPDPEFFGHGALKILARALATVPVVMTALICQYNLHPLMSDLSDYTPTRMRSVVALTLTLCSLVYVAAGACGYAVFGRKVQGNVLANLGADVVGDLLGGPTTGLVFVAAIKVGVALVMLTSFPMVMFPLRADIIQAVLAATGGKAMGAAGYYTVTYACLALVYLTAIAVKSAYQMTGLVGAVCGIAVAFIFPGMLAWRAQAAWGWWRAFAVVLVVVGTVLMTAGIAAPILDRGQDVPAVAGLLVGRLAWGA